MRPLPLILLIATLVLWLTSCELNRQTRPHPATDFPDGISVGGFESPPFWGQPPIEFTSLFDTPQTMEKSRLPSH